MPQDFDLLSALAKDATLTALRDALRGADNKTLSDLAVKLVELIAKLPAGLDGGRLPTAANVVVEGVAVTAQNPLPVDVGANIDLGNVTVSFESTLLATPQFATPLAANETRYSDWFDVKDFAAIKVLILVDQISAVNGAVVQFSEDPLNGVLRNTSATIPPNSGQSFGIPRLGRYVRFGYTNGATPQIVAPRISVLASFTPMSNAQLPLGATVTDANVAGTAAAMGFGRQASGVWKPIEVTSTGAQKVELAAQQAGLSLEATQEIIAATVNAALNVGLSTRASETKQDAMITKLEEILAAAQAIAIDADSIALDADTINLSTDQLEAVMGQVRDRLPASLGQKVSNDSLAVVLSTAQEAIFATMVDKLTALNEKDFATETTLAAVKSKTDNLDIALSALRDALRGGNAKTLTDLASLLTTISSLDFATEATQNKRYGGGTTPVVVTATNIGSTNIHTPAPGKRIVLRWIEAINDPTASTPTQIKIKLGATELYRVWAVSHWEEFTGGVDESLTIELSAPGTVLVTAHIKEI